MIGIDYTPAYEQGGGIGRYVRELVAALAALDRDTPYRLYVQGAHRDKLPNSPGANFTWKASRISTEWSARIWHRARLPIPIELWTGRIDLFHATDFVLPPTRARTLLTVHDLSFVRRPETAFPALKAYLDQVVPRSIQRADHILADSQATKTDLIDVYAVQPDKVTVLLSGVDSRFQPVPDSEIERVRIKYGIAHAPYLFNVGTVQPRKNYERLMQALATLPAPYADVQLVIAGGKGWLQDPIYQAVDRLKLSERVQFIGFADDKDLPALYSGARAVPFVSLYEGFGLPVLEAMACGVPVVTSNVSSMPEAAGEAALLVDPESVDQIRDTMIRVLGDESLRADLIQRGLERAQSFTWRRAAEQLRAIYRSYTGS